MPLFGLEGKVAIVTGGANGIGFEVARAFLKANCKGICLVDLTEESLQTAAHQLAEYQDRIVICAADCSSDQDTQRYVDVTVQRFGQLDISCQVAGISGPKASILDLSAEQFDNVIAINLRSAFLGIKYSAKAMLASPSKGKGCSITVCSSNMGHTGWPDYCAYVSSKSAIRGLSASAAQELGVHGIRVNAVSPGAIGTAMTKKFIKNNPGAEEALKARIPLDRIAEVEECANAFLYLASDIASYMSGTTIACDGGMARFI